MDTWVTPRDVLMQKLEDVALGAQTQPHALYSMLTVVGGDRKTRFDVDAPFKKMALLSPFKGTALMYAAQEGYVHDEGYVHGAQVFKLVDKY
jgi:hypothetical protein